MAVLFEIDKTKQHLEFVELEISPISIIQEIYVSVFHHIREFENLAKLFHSVPP